VLAHSYALKGAYASRSNVSLNTAPPGSQPSGRRCLFVTSRRKNRAGHTAPVSIALDPPYTALLAGSEAEGIPLRPSEDLGQNQK
jgi:hypothetical protein